jgi:hypothetical protein
MSQAGAPLFLQRGQVTRCFGAQTILEWVDRPLALVYNALNQVAEARLRLRWQPEVPRVTFRELSGEIPVAWEIYLDVNG